MNVNVENRWTSGNISVVITLLVMVVGLGVTYGQVMTRLETVEEASKQSVIDSRTLIRVENDVAYIKESIQRIERAAMTASTPFAMCPTEKPILVASHCRSSASSSQE